uniref:Uncharacterized protein n=1 Tax=Setaria viridis TaxID=4556 RepID=A0A4U6T9E0_SETVI|nr:hypothetical protein SEVIR_9G491650v2 [Setaria viridis]
MFHAIVIFCSTSALYHYGRVYNWYLFDLI